MTTDVSADSHEHAPSPQVMTSEKVENEGNSEEIPANIKVHPVALAINVLLASLSDIESLARTYVPLSSERRHQQFDELVKALESDSELLKEDSDNGPGGAIITRVLDSLQKLVKLEVSREPEMLTSSLFLGMFSAYEIFTGDLLTAIYEKKPELFNKMNRQIQVSEILRHESFTSLKAAVLDQEIESFRRKSYVEQFEELESTFGILLKKFKQWPQFVECGQRRNLITHCGGVISDQYISICKKEGYIFADDVVIGQKLRLDDNYLLTSCELIMRVGFELGQTLWRKIFPEEIVEADAHLRNVIYLDCLRMQRWDRAIVFGEFAVGQKKSADDVSRKISVINYAIGLKFGGQPEKAKEVLAEVDWSGAAAEFKLADAVLNDRFDEASAIMKRIGKEGEMVKEPAYHEWPLFHEFRRTTQFLEAYEAVYGHPFAIELKRAANRAAIKAVTSEQTDSETNHIRGVDLKVGGTTGCDNAG